MADLRFRRGPKTNWRPILFVGLLAAFTLRVGAQVVQTLSPSPQLQPFERWRPEALSYPLLLVSQTVIIVVGMWAAWAMWTGRPHPQPRLGRVMVWIGWVYLVGAAFRFFAGLTVLSPVPGFDMQLPGFFHIALASMVLTFAAHLADEARGTTSRQDPAAAKGRGQAARKQV